jgi:serine/threonine protein kinase
MFGVVLLVQANDQDSPLKHQQMLDLDESDLTRNQRFSALKVINKNALHPEEVKVIRGEAKILEMLKNESNVVQIRDVSS